MSVLKMKYYKLLIISFAVFIFCCGNIYGIEITELKCNFKNNPLGINQSPQFIWILHSGERNQVQSAYHILLSDDPLLLNKNIGNIWDTKKVISEQSINVFYEGNTLESAKEYFWKVKVWDKDGKESSWSGQSQFVTGLFDREDWRGAQWIGYEEIPDSLILVPGVHPWGNDVKNTVNDLFIFIKNEIKKFIEEDSEEPITDLFADSSTMRSLKGRLNELYNSYDSYLEFRNILSDLTNINIHFKKWVDKTIIITFLFSIWGGIAIFLDLQTNMNILFYYALWASFGVLLVSTSITIFKALGYYRKLGSMKSKVRIEKSKYADVIKKMG